GAAHNFELNFGHQDVVMPPALLGEDSRYLYIFEINLTSNDVLQLYGFGI
ncbi:7193_t:CDS:2, partial [Entrophospora sp. SA101]